MPDAERSEGVCGGGSEMSDLGYEFNKKVGTLKINESFSIALYKKMPNRFHRFMSRILLGWIYEECNNG